jgi:hypothetical protein
MIELLDQSEKDQETGNESKEAITPPAAVDPDWAVKIKRAREAHEAGRRFRKDQPASSTGLLDP